MIDMSTWEELKVDVVNDLSLDPRNVRLDLPSSVPESDIVQDLFTNEKALSLVEGISKVGLLTHEVPIVVKRGEQLVVVEGNRRVAALKALQNPYLAPDYQARIDKFAKLIPERDSVRWIVVKLAPSQEDADQLIAALHTGNQRLAWTPARQAAFFQAQLDSGKTAEQLISQYPTVDVRKFVIRGRILQLFRDVSYDEASIRDYARKRRFPVSTLARLYENDEFLALVGIEVEAGSGEVELVSDGETFKRVATKIVSDIRDGKINTRSLNKKTSSRYIEYMDELRDLLNQADLGNFDFLNAADDDGDSNPTSPRDSRENSDFPKDQSRNEPESKDPTEPVFPGNQKAKPFPKKRNYLSTDRLVVPPEFPPSIHEIVKELSAINIQRFPNAAMDLLRTFLEKTIKAYAEVLDEKIRKQSNEQGFVYLSNCLIWLEDHFKMSGQTALIQPINIIRGGRHGFIASKDHLDAMNHNHHIVATPDDVRECWSTIEGIMKAVLKS